ncbi:MAG: tRNA lysidine(34) synthetase TilS [Elusimicrobia bacterium]|nr:tRNA lysidine(34) synthetase TilS [Elusimicrobiota bacterium]
MLTKAEFHGRIWSKLLRYERERGLLASGDRVLVAVSGGPDSVCLADFLARLAGRRGLELRLAHFDHGLRGRSARRDEASVRRLAARLGLPLAVRRLPVAAFARRERRSLEDSGRALRYRALRSLARRYRCSKVATGHLQDDQAETVLLHLLRGSRAEGLAGIPARRALGPGVEVVRPLLCLARDEVLGYLRYRELPWREDPTNREPRFRRNWVRHELLPLLAARAPGLRERLAAMAEELGAAFRSAPRPEGGAAARVRSTERPRPASRGARGSAPRPRDRTRARRPR